MKTKIAVGDIIEVSITGIQPYGAFALLPNGDSGLIHISEISDKFVRNIESFVHLGEKINVKVLDFDTHTHQAKLSLKAIDTRLKRREKRTTYRHPRRPIKETPKGFAPLKEMLPVWIAESTIMQEEKQSD
ncbi:General stress protein 13 [Clostridiales bacterium CHKCI006]|uniref:S1 RNA-binding domain-containing protein n=1 Tax=Candidatus Fimiplasma intestinipullorum TaxID=2840825 RepID=A0A9D1L1B4_9FIRM|nr:General stress protein 13 [Clostridiales bacterium CHKCI006]HIU14649.1 S1 RNA-binding domain-containing protein [Candidatus Fimiplasma intestinipullorum]